MKTDKIESCADMIGIYNDRLVLVERLNFPSGLALPGGRLELGESLEQCAVREFKEETGLDFEIKTQFRTYSNPNRDPRGQKVSTVFIGIAKGIVKNEAGKTKVMLFDLTKIEDYNGKFAFDHYKIIQEWLKTVNFKRDIL